MGVDYVDVEASFQSCAENPSDVTVRLTANRDESPLDLDEVITETQHERLLDASSSFTTFKKVASVQVPAFWGPVSAPNPENVDDDGGLAFYYAYKRQRQMAMRALCR